MIELIIVFTVLCIFILIKLNNLNLKKYNLIIPNTAKKVINGRLRLKPYGCFTNIKDKFFKKKINPYSDYKMFDSGIVINNNYDIKKLINKIIINGFDIYGHKLLKKYHSGDYSNITIEELGYITKFLGYEYISIFKTKLHTRGNIYLTYSPPLDINLSEFQDEYTKYISKTDLKDYKLLPKLNNYKNETEYKSTKELSCGYPCLSNGEPEIYKNQDGSISQYMCGSVAYPTIKTPPRYAIYKIVEEDD